MQYNMVHHFYSSMRFFHSSTFGYMRVHNWYTFLFPGPRCCCTPGRRARLKAAESQQRKGTQVLPTIIFPVFGVQYSRFCLLTVFPKMSTVSPLFYSSGDATNISVPIVSQTGNRFQLSRAQHTSLERSRTGREKYFTRVPPQKCRST